MHTHIYITYIYTTYIYTYIHTNIKKKTKYNMSKIYRNNYRTYDTYDTLIHKIFKTIRTEDKMSIKTLIQKCSNLEETMIKIYEIVAKYDIVADDNRQEFIVSKIIEHLGIEGLNSKTFVDIGGGNGNVLGSICKLVTGSPSKFICVENKNDWTESYKFDNKFVTYKFWENATMDVPDNSIDIALCMVALHHMNESVIDITLKEIKRIMKKSGIFLIKEHDATANSVQYIDWEHHLYHINDSCIVKNFDPIKYKKTMLHNFKDMPTWIKLIENHGFKLKGVYDRFLGNTLVKDDKNVSNLFWMSFINA